MARAGATVINRGTGVVGEVRSAMISEADFQAQFGTEWVLMDGQSVVGSKYETITGNSIVPDARGRFLRGKNNGRSSASGNANGELALGTEQDDHTRRPRGTAFTTNNDTHSHGVNCGITLANPATNNGFYIAGSGGGLTTDSDVHNHSITGGGDAETTPRNVTINYFIKIN